MLLRAFWPVVFLSLALAMPAGAQPALESDAQFTLSSDLRWQDR